MSASSTASSTASSALRFIDIGANLTDGMFRGLYHDKQYHPDDLEQVLGRAFSSGLEHIIITGGTLTESAKALDLASRDGASVWLCLCRISMNGHIRTEAASNQCTITKCFVHMHIVI